MSLDEEITLVRSTGEIDEAVRAYAALECVFNAPGPANDTTTGLLSGRYIFFVPFRLLTIYPCCHYIL